MSKIKMFLMSVIAFSVVTTVAWAYSYDITIPVKGKTAASEQLQRSSLFTIYSFAHRIATPDCTSFAITDTKVSKAKLNGKWEEIWTIKACERTAYVPVEFTDTTYFVNPMGVKYAK